MSNVVKASASIWSQAVSPPQKRPIAPNAISCGGSSPSGPPSAELAGNQTWFAREDYVEEAWRIVDPILDEPNVSAYQPGTWGPAEAAKLIAPYGGWFDPK